ncbi:hypothetical protein J6590_008623, partial [Homalodisca vitripennis]
LIFEIILNQSGSFLTSIYHYLEYRRLMEVAVLCFVSKGKGNLKPQPAYRPLCVLVTTIGNVILLKILGGLSDH